MHNHKNPTNSPLSPESISVFLAGSIEMGKAEDWQSETIKALSDLENIEVFNPRRDDWDSSWKQEESNRQFNHHSVAQPTTPDSELHTFRPHLGAVYLSGSRQGNGACSSSPQLRFGALRTGTQHD